MAATSVAPVLVTVKVNAVVPLSPSALLTSSMVSVGRASSLTIVPWPWLSLMVAPGDGLDEVDVEQLIGFVCGVAADEDGHRLGRVAGAERQCAGGRQVVVARIACGVAALDRAADGAGA